MIPRRPAQRLRRMRLAAVLFGSFCCAIAGTSTAATIDFDVQGTNNGSAVDFYGVVFTSGDGSDFIQSLKYTLPSGVFDRVSAVPNPNVDLGSLNGLALSDITFTPPNLSGGANGPELTVSFAPGSFGVGDSFRFGYDVDGLLGFNSNAAAFGIQGVLVEAYLEGQGLLGGDQFEVVNPGPNPDELSVAQIGPPTAVPEPTSLLLWGAGVAVFIRRKRRESK